MNINLNYHVKKLIDHVWGPSGSVLIHILVILALIKFVTYTKVEKAPDVEVMIMEPDATDLEEFDKELEKIEGEPIPENERPSLVSVVRDDVMSDLEQDIAEFGDLWKDLAKV